MARGQYQAKVQRPGQALAESELACRTCPFWERTSEAKGVCHGTAGPLAVSAGNGVFPTTGADDWCRLHPAAQKQA